MEPIQSAHIPRGARAWGMSERAIYLSYAQSFIFVALFLALARAEANVVQLLLLDFMGVNPLETQHAMSTMKIDTLAFAIVDIVGVFLVFAPPQLFQVVLTSVLESPLGDEARFTPLMILPVTAVLTWYCYDYLTPSNLCFAGNCMPVYEHGISAERYLAILLVQTPITLFSFFYFDAGLSGRSKVRVLLVALATVIIVGLILGCLRARFQLQYF